MLSLFCGDGTLTGYRSHTSCTRQAGLESDLDQVVVFTTSEEAPPSNVPQGLNFLTLVGKAMPWGRKYPPLLSPTVLTFFVREVP